MQRRETLKTIGGVSIASILGLGASGTAAAGTHGRGGQTRNPGRVGRYNGNRTLVPQKLGGFDRVLLYIADGLTEEETGWDGAANAEFFQREIMGRSDEEILETRNEAVEFHREFAGLEFPEADPDNLFGAVESEDGTAILSAGMLDPGRGYTAYVVSGRGMPNNHGDGTTVTDPEVTGHVRDGTFGARFTEPTELGGSYGAEFPDYAEVPAGASLPFGDYNIRMGDNEDPIEIRFFPEHPVIFEGPAPSAFNCELVHEEWGEGQVHGTTGGTMAPGIRNVLTFPPSLE